MALLPGTNIPAVCYTGDLQKIEVVASEGSKVKLKVRHDKILTGNHGTQWTTVFLSSYTANGGRVVVYDLGSLLETYMHDMDGVQKFQLVFSDEEDNTLVYDVWVVYCKRHRPYITAEQLVNESFLTAHLTRFVRMGSKDEISFINIDTSQQTNTVKYTLIVRGDDGLESHSASIPRVSHGTVVTLDSGLNQIVKGVFYFKHIDVNKVIAYSITVGNRKARFFVVQRLPNRNVRSFRFRNMFGIMEHLCVPTERNEKTETQSSEAVCEEEITLYDVVHTKTFEEQTPVLTNKEIRRFEEFLTSHHTTIEVNGVEYPINIKSYELNKSDKPGEGCSVKFGWQFASKRTPVMDDDGIDASFDPNFSDYPGVVSDLYM